MRVVKRGAAAVALAALVLPAVARADELLVMPYACSMAGKQPVLTPGPEQGHRIFGQRDQRKFQACSPVNPGMCRQFTVHRFDLDCDGERVSWVSVVAASNEGSRRAWLLDGRLLLRMGPKWSLAPDDPCAQDPGSDERPTYGGRLRRQCAERLALAPPPVVEMPFGFAPMLGIDGIFVTGTPPPGVAKTPPVLPPIVAGGPPPKSAAPDGKSAAADAKAPVPPAPLPWPEREPKASEPKAKEALLPPPPPTPATVPAPQPAPKPAPKVAATPQAAPTAPPTVEDPAKKAEAEPKPGAPTVAPTAPPAAAKAAPPPGSHGPRLVTIPPPPAAEDGASAPKATVPKTAAPVPPSVSEVQKKATPADSVDTSPAPKVAVASAPKPGAQPKSEAEPERGFSPGLLNLFRTTTTGAIVAFAGLALGLLAAFAMARRREHAKDAGRRRRDISALSLDGKQARGSVRTGAAPRSRPEPSVSPTAPPKQVSPPPAAPPDLMGRLAMTEVEAADWDDRMPRTREEALEVLGIGIAPSANATAIKKIVDGLRMSWHPDLAKNETDRALREQRSKQINAAWDIILQNQRAEV